MAQDKTIYDVLEQEHRLVSRLLERAQAADAEEREDLLAEVSQQLVSHSEAESETFYAALRDHEETRELVEEAESEHQDVAALLDQIDHSGEESAIATQMRELARRFQEVKQSVADEGLTTEDLLEE